MNTKPLRVPLLLSLWLVTSLACSLTSPATSTPAPVITETPSLTAFPTDTPIPPPTETPPPPATDTPEPLSERVTLTSVHFEESGQAPNYTITSETPNLTGVDDPRVQAFNLTAEGIVKGAVNEFTASLKYQPAVPITSGSFIEVGYEVMARLGSLLSLRFNVMGYGDGAAHPYHYAQTLNWDLEKGVEIQLFQLFKPDASYLQVISDYCKAELSKRDIAFDAFQTGADPTKENYRNWNITPDGLVITFDEYQVAAYAAGAQTVVIPYSALSDILDPQGPLAQIVQ